MTVTTKPQATSSIHSLSLLDTAITDWAGNGKEHEMDRLTVFRSEAYNLGITDAFVSYSRRDSEFVRQLVNSIESDGKSVWLDTSGIRDGEVFSDVIRA